MSLPLTYKKGNCFINAYINSRHALKDLGLKYKIGSLGLNGWFEYGGKTWDKKKFMASWDGDYSFDAHAWLEDAEGNVYDFSFQHYNWVARVRTNKGLGLLGEIRGMSKADLKAKGLSYVEADKETQTAIFLKTLPHSRETEQGLLNGTRRWIEMGPEEAYLATDIQQTNKALDLLAKIEEEAQKLWSRSVVAK